MHPCCEDGVQYRLVCIEELRVLDGKEEDDEDVCDRHAEHAHEVKYPLTRHVLEGVWRVPEMPVCTIQREGGGHCLSDHDDHERCEKDGTSARLVTPRNDWKWGFPKCNRWQKRKQNEC